MSDTKTPPTLTQLQIIVLAMMVGVLTFSVVAMVIRPRIAPQPELARMLPPILAVVGVVELLVYYVLRRATRTRLRQSVEEDRLPDDDLAGRVLPAMATLTIIGAAMAEGFGLFGVVVFLLTAAWPSLAAPAIALVILVLKVPTQDKLSQFVAIATGNDGY